MLLLLLQFFHSLSHIEARRKLADENNMNSPGAVHIEQTCGGIF